MIQCPICNHEGHLLDEHIAQVHSMDLGAFKALYPNAKTVSPELKSRWEAQVNKVKRTAIDDLENVTIAFAGVNPKINPDVPEEVCLPLPPHYRIPSVGTLGKDLGHAAISLASHRSMYVWGLPGTGKDALFHAWSNWTRTPALIFQVQPGVDIQSWFFSRSFDANGTKWEEGEMLKALRDGYTSPISGRVIPYMILISDFDRADRAQAESMRLVMDSISGRVKGPGGATYPVLKGTQIVVTANSAGAGDTRGRCISSNPLDASILDRFERKFQFHWMDWKDESEICKAKFPTLVQQHPGALDTVGKITFSLRSAIAKDEVYAEFSHRALCAWLGHAEDLMQYRGSMTTAKLLKHAARVFLDGMPDEETRNACCRLMDPHIGGGMLKDED